MANTMHEFYAEIAKAMRPTQRITIPPASEPCEPAGTTEAPAEPVCRCESLLWGHSPDCLYARKP